MNQAGALVHVYADGSIALNHGGTEMGQGLNIKVAQVVAEEFQVDIDRVKITATTTAKVPNTSPTAASSGSDLNGMAARNAAAAIKARLVRFLAERHQADPAEVALPAEPHPHQGARGLLRPGDRRGLSRARPSVGGRLLRHAQDPLGPRRRAKAGRSSISPMARRCPRWPSTR